MIGQAQKVMKHAEYQERVERLPSIALRHIRADAQEAIEAMPDGVNAGYYADEINYCAMELKKRAKQSVCREKEYAEALTQMFLIMKESGCCGEDMIEDLRALVVEAAK